MRRPLPRLHFLQYMIDMLVYWIKDFDLDGFRCDAAGEVATDFWEQARAAWLATSHRKLCRGLRMS